MDLVATKLGDEATNRALRSFYDLWHGLPSCIALNKSRKYWHLPGNFSRTGCRKARLRSSCSSLSRWEQLHQIASETYIRQAFQYLHRSVAARPRKQKPHTRRRSLQGKWPTQMEENWDWEHCLLTMTAIDPNQCPLLTKPSDERLLC